MKPFFIELMRRALRREKLGVCAVYLPLLDEHARIAETKCSHVPSGILKLLINQFLVARVSLDAEHY